MISPSQALWSFLPFPGSNMLWALWRLADIQEGTSRSLCTMIYWWRHRICFFALFFQQRQKDPGSVHTIPSEVCHFLLVVTFYRTPSPFSLFSLSLLFLLLKFLVICKGAEVGSICRLIETSTCGVQRVTRNGKIELPCKIDYFRCWGLGFSFFYSPLPCWRVRA